VKGAATLLSFATYQGRLGEDEQTEGRPGFVTRASGACERSLVISTPFDWMKPAEEGEREGVARMLKRAVRWRAALRDRDASGSEMGTLWEAQSGQRGEGRVVEPVGVS